MYVESRGSDRRRYRMAGMDKEIAVALMDKEIAMALMDKEIAVALMDKEIAVAVTNKEIAVALVDKGNRSGSDGQKNRSGSDGQGNRSGSDRQGNRKKIDDPFKRADTKALCRKQKQTKVPKFQIQCFRCPRAPVRDLKLVKKRLTRYKVILRGHAIQSLKSKLISLSRFLLADHL